MSRNEEQYEKGYDIGWKEAWSGKYLTPPKDKDWQVGYRDGFIDGLKDKQLTMRLDTG